MKVDAVSYGPSKCVELDHSKIPEALSAPETIEKQLWKRISAQNFYSDIYLVPKFVKDFIRKFSWKHPIWTNLNSKLGWRNMVILENSTTDWE